MKHKALKVLVLFVMIMFLVAAFTATARENEPRFVEELAVPVAQSGLVIEPKGAAGDAVYIVRLQEAPLATYRGGQNGLDATSPAATGAKKLNVNTPASVAYRDYLAAVQAVFLADTERLLGRSLDVLYQYDVTFNGVALTLSPAEASAVAKQPSVLSVSRDQWRYPQTDVSPAFIGADTVWDGSGVAGDGTKGEGIIVGIIDSGIWPEHPSFADDGSFPSPPAGWSGICESPADATTPVTCTNKLVGARFRIAGYSAAVGGYDGLFKSARDDNGHGTHTASTAAGNENVLAVLLGVNRGKISGIAPRAHVAAYKGLGPRGGVSSDLVAAIDAAVADGVDVINYSIGGGATSPWADADSLAFLAAREAGVFVATSAGNSGPGADTVGSPGNAPWITTVGASTSNRHFISDITLEGPGSPPEGIFGASVTAGVANFNLVDAEGIADAGGDATGRCINPYPAGTFKANDVVLCQRGAVARVVRGDNVKAGGGGGVILYNADPAQGLSTDNYVIPAVHVTNETGLKIKQYLNAHVGQVTVSFTAGQKVLSGSDPRVVPDMMADFSSRGPNGPVLDIIKPDTTAPGVQILAGNTPQCIDPTDNACGAPGQLFQAIQGTSMSSPHVAGAAALVAAQHPDWTPAEIESALMTTSITSVVKEDGSTQADAFDMGAGRIDVTNAANAPLILHETHANYLAANPVSGGDPKTLNISSMANSRCVSSCSWNRTVENSSGETLTWKASLDGISGTVEPQSFTLAPGAKQALQVSVNTAGLNAGAWNFATLLLDPQKEGIQTSHMPIAVMAELGSLPDTIIIDTRRDAGSYLLEDMTASEITNMTIMPYGLEPAIDTYLSLMQDETNDDPFDDLSQVWYMTFDVSVGTARFVNEILDSSAPDVDMFVGMDGNNNGLPDVAELRCESTTPGWNEYCNIEMPEAGQWWVMLQNWASSDANLDDIKLATGIVPMIDLGNLSFDGPAAVPEAQPFDLNVLFNVESYAGQAWYGAFSVGTDAQQPGNLGVPNVNLYRLDEDVQKTVDKMSARPGDKVEFTIHVLPNVLNRDVAYTLIDMIPDGLTYVPNSAAASSGAVEVVDNQITWTGTLPSVSSLEPSYKMTTSANDPLCDTGLDGYVNLEEFGIYTQEDAVGDSTAFGFFSSGDPIDFFGEEYESMYVSDDGFAIFDPSNNYEGETWTPQTIPSADKPNNLAAMMWQDLEVFYDEAANQGISAATAGDEVMIVEFDNIEFLGGSEDQFDFEIVMTRSVDDTPGAYEIVFAYDNLNGTLAGPLTVGLENALGSQAVALVNNASAEGVLKDGFMVCFDAETTQTGVTVSYQVTVDVDAGLGALINRVTSTTDTPGSEETTAYGGVYVGYPIFNPAIPAKQ